MEVDLTVRLSLMATLILHEWAHLIAVPAFLRRRAFANNFRGGLSFSEWGLLACPGTSIMKWPSVSLDKELPPHTSVFVQVAGLVASYLLAATSIGLWYSTSFSRMSAAIMGGALISGTSAHVSDFIGLEFTASGIFHCGNWGVLRSSSMYIDDFILETVLICCIHIHPKSS